MLIKNRSGRVLEVPEQLAKEMMRKGEAVLVDEAPERKGLGNVCPYCFEKNPTEEHKEECKKKAPLVSVIIPSRVEEEIISLPSLENQSYKKLEIIVERDKKKEGAPVCRNRGFKKSKGDFVLFSDNDLEWDEDAIAILHKTLIENPKAAYAYGSYTLDGKLVGHQEFSSHDLWKWNYISTMALIRRKDFPGFDPKLKRFQDWDLWLTMLGKGKEGKFCGQCLFSTKYRDGITLTDREDVNKRRAEIMKKHSIKDAKIADIVIPHQNRHDCLKVVLERLSYDAFNIVVISGKTFAENCNKGAKLAETDDIILMNDDIEPQDEVIRQMLSSKADIVGAAQITPSWHPEKVWYGISYKWKDGFIAESITDRLENALIPTGFLLRFKRKVWEDLGGFDEEYKNGGEDQEILLTALEKGYTIDIVKIPTTHHHSQSRDRFKHTSDNRKRLNKRWTQERIKNILDNHKKQCLWLK